MKDETGEVLRKRRLDAGLTQKDVADKLGVTQGTVSNWEAGKGPPKTEQLASLESFLGPLTDSHAEQQEAEPEVSAFGVWLNRVRTKKSLTVVELAGKAGVSVPTIYNLESGRIDNPQERTRKRLADALGETLPMETVKATEDAANIEGLGNLVDFDPHDEDALQSVDLQV